MSPIHDLSGKVVLITGIGCVGEGWGNGYTTATLFARQGAILYGADLKLEAAERSRDLIRKDLEVTGHPSRKSGENVCDVYPEGMDVTKSENCKKIVEACVAKHGRIDILVNNVGMSQPGGPAEMSEEVWDAQVDVNLKHVYLMCRLVLPIMEKQALEQHTRSAVLNVGSIAGLRYIGKPQVAYAATKAAVVQFTKHTSVLYAQRTHGLVRLNVVVPGLVDTPLVRGLAQMYAGADPEEYRRMRDRQVPSGEMGTGWDVAHAALFLCSDEAKYITGQEIVVDGSIVNSTGRTDQDFLQSGSG
ncbi:NAD(P)-binding protein [Polychaeton citri CBS 116435]|uniref:NAD(P)-binding protein n=1 Tax=Polychaeton citri CBS 116435 TaxID=1314669 RepID=A0A9P4UVL4_9PEZI|nr:NAD(P)-binding protein [Polychaeton citri CBS 116435]